MLPETALSWCLLALRRHGTPSGPQPREGSRWDSPEVLHHAGEHGCQLLHGGELVPAGGAGGQGRARPGPRSRGDLEWGVLPGTYPWGNCDAPTCCPGASTWHTTKCLVISCMSSKLKKVLKHSLSAKTHVAAVAQQRGGEACGPEREGRWR